MIEREFLNICNYDYTILYYCLGFMGQQIFKWVCSLYHSLHHTPKKKWKTEWNRRHYVAVGCVKHQNTMYGSWCLYLTALVPVCHCCVLSSFFYPLLVKSPWRFVFPQAFPTTLRAAALCSSRVCMQLMAVLTLKASCEGRHMVKL